MGRESWSLVAPVYVKGGRVQFWYVHYDVPTDTARLGYELMVMNPPTREVLGETWYSFEEARTLLHPSMWESARKRLAELRAARGARLGGGGG